MTQPASPAAPGRVLGVDLGQKRVGLAVSDSGRRVATPVEILEPSSPDELVELLSQRIEELGVVLVVVGLPLGLSGDTGIAARSVKSVVKGLSEGLTVPVELYDERLSSREATRRPLAANKSRAPRRAGKVRVDDRAAAIFLQAFLEHERAAR